MKYAILKSLAGTYCNTLHVTGNDLVAITKACEELNDMARHGITYKVVELVNYEL